MLITRAQHTRGVVWFDDEPLLLRAGEERRGRAVRQRVLLLGRGLGLTAPTM
jgi:hypothetical protein